ncbi:MAG: hypothetical protein CM15mP62_13760 [Rhodospirillaceae bacterium]|nr:MAG: hypothetical protein CM15mP62_13760 [Rhodospirillaceae bacterium]
MNNQMALFSPWPNNPNEVSKVNVLFSSMMPSIILKNNSVKLVLGASGSTDTNVTNASALPLFPAK